LGPNLKKKRENQGNGKDLKKENCVGGGACQAGRGNRGLGRGNQTGEHRTEKKTQHNGKRESKEEEDISRYWGGGAAGRKKDGGEGKKRNMSSFRKFWEKLGWVNTRKVGISRQTKILQGKKRSKRGQATVFLPGEGPWKMRGEAKEEGNFPNFEGVKAAKIKKGAGNYHESFTNPHLRGRGEKGQRKRLTKNV